MSGWVPAAAGGARVALLVCLTPRQRQQRRQTRLGPLPTAPAHGLQARLRGGRAACTWLGTAGKTVPRGGYGSRPSVRASARAQGRLIILR